MKTEIIIDDEFRYFFPALDNETNVWLEESLLQHGCQHPLVLWNGILIDGHHRYEIIRKHRLPFTTISKDFESRDSALIWIINNQVTRRSLAPMQLSYYRGLHFNTDKKLVGNNRGNNQHKMCEEELPHNEVIPKIGSTASRLAEKYNVSRATIERDSQVANAITAIGMSSPDAKKEILAGKTRISRKKLMELAGGSDEEIVEVAAEIENGTFEKNKPGASKQDGENPPADSGQMEMLPLEKKFHKLTGEFSIELRVLENKGDTDALRMAFQSYILSLEKMHSSI